MKVFDEFSKCFDKFNKHHDQSLDWFIKSWNYKAGTKEKELCFLKYRFLRIKAMEDLEEALKELKMTMVWLDTKNEFFNNCK